MASLLSIMPLPHLKQQLNDLTAWQLRLFIPPNTPSIPVVKCNNCDGSCKYKKDLDF